MSAIGNGSVYHRGFGIKKRSWFGGRSRPAFMEPMPPGGPQGVPPPNGGKGVPPPRDGYERGELGGSGGGGGAGGGPLQVMRRSRSSSFPLKDDAGYIGYLTDDDDNESGGDASDVMMKVLNRRRRELMGSDIGFSTCMFMMIAVVGLLFLFLFAASPWGIPPPRRL